MPVTLEDLLNLPANPTDEHLNRLGLLKPPPEQPSIVPPATVPTVTYSHTPVAGAPAPIAPNLESQIGKEASQAKPTLKSLSPIDLGAAPAFANAPPAAGNPLPSVFGEPTVHGAIDRPGSSRFFENQLQQMEAAKEHPATGFKGALQKAGNVALDVFAPGVAAAIPGTDIFNRLKEQHLLGELGKAQTQEGQEEARKSEEEARKGTEAYQKGELANKERELNLAEKKEKFEEENLPKQGIDQKAVDAKMKETNPDTGKPFTAYEARVSLAQDMAATKNQPPHTVVMLDKEGGKPYEFQYVPGGNFSGDQGHGDWKKIGLAKPDALSLGLVGSLTPLLDAQGNIVGTFNTKTGAFTATPKPGAGENAPPQGASTASGARLKNTEANQFNTQYIKPATDVETNFKKAQAAMDAYNANPQTGAAGMVELSQHIATTLGSVKGVSVGETMIHEHENAIGLEQKLSRFIDHLKTGQPLSAQQMKDFNQLIHETRDITWNVAAKEAARRHQPIDFLPNDVTVKMADSKGNARPVPGDRVQEYLDKGAKIQ